MRQELLRRLAPVRRRLSIRNGWPLVSRAIGVGGLGALVLGVLRLATAGAVPAWTAWSVLGIALVGGLARAWRRRATLSDAALVVDRHGGWQDTLTTALRASAADPATPMQRRVLERARPLLGGISARAVVPLRVGAGAVRDTLLAAAAIALTLCPLFRLEPTSWRQPAPLPPASEMSLPAADLRASAAAGVAEGSWRTFRRGPEGEEPGEGNLAVQANDSMVRVYFRSAPLRGQGPNG